MLVVVLGTSRSINIDIRKYVKKGGNTMITPAHIFKFPLRGI